MRLTIATADLLSAARAVLRCVPPRRASVPKSMQNLRIRSRDTEDRVYIFGHALDTAVEASRPAVVTEGGSIDIDARMLVAILVSTQAGEITIDRDEAETDAETHITAGGVSYTLKPPTDHGGMFMEPEAMGRGAPQFSIGAEAFTDLLRSVAWAIGDGDKAVIPGLYFEAEGRRLLAVTTNGYSLATASADLLYPVKAPLSIIMPGAAIPEIIRAVKPGGVTLQARAERWRVTAGDWSLCGRVLDGTWPNYKQILPDPDTRGRFTVKTADLAAALRRAKALGGDRFDWGGKLITLTGEENCLRLSIETRLGSIDETIPRSNIDDNTRSLKSSFDVEQLLSSLKSISTPDVIVSFDTRLTPVLLIDTAHADRYALVMPVNRA